MSVKKRRLFWLAGVTASVAFIGLLWTSARTKAVAPSANGSSGAPASTSPAGGTAHASPPQSNQGNGAPAPATIQVEPLTLKPNGFEPDEITRPAGPFVLMVNNSSRVADVSFELFREDGHKAKDLKGPKGRARPSKLIDLPPGNYLLKEVNHPEWTCRIVLSR